MTTAIIRASATTAATTGATTGVTTGAINQRYYNQRYGNHYGQRCSNGSTGTILGAIAGGLLGREIAGRGDRTVGAIIGAGAGALVGRAIDRNALPPLRHTTSLGSVARAGPVSIGRPALCLTSPHFGEGDHASMVEGLLCSLRSPSTACGRSPSPEIRGGMGRTVPSHSLSNKRASCSTIVPPNCSASMIVDGAGCNSG